jgi:putative transcriptional regulator
MQNSLAGGFASCASHDKPLVPAAPPAGARGYPRPLAEIEKALRVNREEDQGGRLMASRKRNIGPEILEGIREIKRGEHGRVTTIPSVSSIREKTGLSQTVFARLLGVSVRTLQEWEQGRRAPSGAARTLLLIAAKNPNVLLDVA